MNRTFYHGTLKKNVPSILKKGLIPKHPQGIASEPTAIFMWNNLESAKNHCAYDEVIFEVYVPLNVQIYKRSNDGESVDLPIGQGYEYFVREKIPPENLKIVYEGFEYPEHPEIFKMR
jgi:hypothetical protein